MKNQRLKAGDCIKAWLCLLRMPFLSVGAFPFLLGFVLAWSQGYPLDLQIVVLSILAVLFIMLMTYLAGEYYDYATDSINASYNKYSGGSRILQVKLIPKQHCLYAVYICASLAALTGFILYFYCQTGPLTIPLGAFGLMCGFFYSAKPIQWAYHGMGEFLIAICYGWLTVNTAYYLQVGHFCVQGTLVAVPLAISIFLVILINEFPDYISDKQSGKKTLVVRLGRERMAVLYKWLMIICYFALIFGVFWNIPWIVVPFSVVLLPIIVQNFKTIKDHGYEDKNVLERICARTILFDIALCIIYMLAFARGNVF